MLDTTLTDTPAYEDTVAERRAVPQAVRPQRDLTAAEVRSGASPWRLARLRRFAVPVLLVLLWQVGSMAGLISSQTLAAPGAVLATAWEMTRSGELPWHLLVSLTRVVVGVAIGASLGTLLALVAGLSRVGEDAVDATTQMLRTLPHLALVPLFILWFGIGETPKIALVALGALFPVYLNLFAGIRGVDPKLAEAGRVFGLDRRGLVRHVILPGALPSALVGLRYALGVAWLSVVVAEQVNAQSGIGYLINDARDFLRTDVILVGLLTYALLGLGADSLVRLLERRLLAWRPVLVRSYTMTASPDAVCVRGLTRRFGPAAPVLDDLDLDLAPGEFVALLGRSGSGKTTLLRTLAGLDPAPEGASLSLPQPVAVAFQEPRLLPWQPVWRNVALGLDGRDARARAEAALAEVGLEHRLDAWPSTLSGGEAQRAALARALVREPRLLLLDEPFAAVDALTRLRMHRLVLDLWGRHRPSILLVTHDVDEAVALADRVLVLDRGHIALDLPNREPRPRSSAREGFVELRTRLLGALGVDERSAA